MMEVWKDVKGFRGLYKISNFGNVSSCERVVKRNNHSDMTISKKQLKLMINISGYSYVTPRKDSIKYTLRVHRLVALHFIKRVKGKSHVNHKDGNKLNNHYANLEWCTQSENNKHAYSIGLKTATRIKVIDNKTKEIYQSITDAAIKNNITKAHLANMLRGTFKNTTNLIIYK